MAYKRRSSGLLYPASANPQYFLHGLGTLPTPAPPPPVETTLFLGDYVGGNFTQWSGVQDTTHGGTSAMGSHTVASIVPLATDPTIPGSRPFAAKFETFGDSTGQTSTPAKARAEVLSTTAQASCNEGESYWYEWWSKHPSADNGGGYSSATGWNIIMQFVTNLPFNTPKVGIQLVGGVPNLYFAVDNGTAASPHLDFQSFLGAITYDHWYHYKLFSKWSTVKATGLVQLFLDDVEVVPLQAAQTRPSDGVAQQWKQGFYRPQANGGNNNTVMHAGTRRYTIT